MNKRNQRDFVGDNSYIGKAIVIGIVILTCISTNAQNQRQTESLSKSTYSGKWMVINNGGAIGSTSRYSVHSSVGEPIIDNNGSGLFAGSGYLSPDSPTPVENPDITGLPSRVELSQNFPNPFNPTTVIKFGLPKRSFVDLTIYNIAGQRVVSLLSQNLNAGYRRVTWDGRDRNGTDVSTGIYIYRLTVNGHIESKQMLLIK